MVIISVCTRIYGVEIIIKFQWESGFLKGVPWTPLCTNGRSEYLMQLSVRGYQKIYIVTFLNLISTINIISTTFEMKP